MKTKKIRTTGLTISIILFFIVSSTAQVTKTVNITSGNLANALLPIEKEGVSHLVINGTIDFRDFEFMRDKMSSLSILDLSNTTITNPANKIPEYAFNTRPDYILDEESGKKSLTSVILPNNLIIVGRNSFAGCSNLSKIIFPNSLTEIEQFAFAGCINMTGKYNYPESLISIGYLAFHRCSSLTSVSFPPSLRYIGPQAFEDCSELDGVLVLPKNLEYIGQSSFQNCGKLDSIIFQANVSTIEKNIFSNCGSLKSIIIESTNITAINDHAFANCASLESIDLPRLIESIGNGTFSGCSSLTYIEIPPLVKTLSGNSFMNCSSLEIIIMPESLKKIGYSAFENCTKLKSIVIPPKVEEIEGSAFFNCVSLEAIYEYSLLVVLGEGNEVFNGVNKTNCLLYVPKGYANYFKTINQWKDFSIIIDMPSISLSSNTINFSPQSSLKELKISENVEWSARSSVSWIKLQPSFGTGLETIRIFAEFNESSYPRTSIITLTSKGIPFQYIYITQKAHIPTNRIITMTSGALSSLISEDELLLITSLSLNGKIDARDFKTMRDEMSSLTYVDLSNVEITSYTGEMGTKYGDIGESFFYPEKTIPETAFHNCYSLNSILLPPTIKTIDVSAFESCYGLNYIDLKSVSSIESRGFSSSGLVSISLPASIKKLGESTFLGCDNLKSVKIETEIIEEYAFENCTNLKSVELSQNVKTIGEGAFSGCETLLSIYVPKSVQQIDNLAFYGVDSINVDTENQNYSSLYGILFNKDKATLLYCPNSRKGSFEIPSTVTTIGSAAFYRCNQLSQVTIPLSVSKIESGAFYGCDQLESIYCYTEVPIDLNESMEVFTDVNKGSCILYIPAGSLGLYQKANQWKDFENMKEMGSLVLSANEITIDALGQNSPSIEITSNTNWNANTSFDWLTISPTIGNGNGSITISATSNPERNTRTGTITISAKNFNDQTIIVTQESNISVDVKAIIVKSKLYPNPAEYYLTITAPVSFITGKITITDIQGRTLLTNSIIQSSEHSIDVSKFKKGTYFVSILKDGKTLTSKFIKQ